VHDFLQLGAVLIVIVVGLLYNGRQIADLRTELRVDLRETRDGLRAELR
jgi:hypothetical protein